MFKCSNSVFEYVKQAERTYEQPQRITAQQRRAVKKTRFGQRNYIRLRDVVSKKVEKNYTRVRQRLKRKWQPQKRNKLKHTLNAKCNFISEASEIIPLSFTL